MYILVIISLFMNKLKTAVLLYWLQAIFWSPSTFSAWANELEQWKANTNLILSFFSTELLLNLIFAAVVIILTFFISKVVSAKLTSYLESSADWEGGNKEELIGVLTRTANITILTLGFTITLWILWVDMAIFMWWLWFWIGFTLKIFLSNFVAWIIMVTQWTYNNGDIIDIGWKVGKIRKINALFTEVEQFDGVVFYIPNIKFLEENVSNFHTNDKRRVEIEVWVDYDSDITKAKQIMLQVVDKFPNVLKAPEPDIFITELADSSINLSLRFWIDSKTWGFFETKSNVTETINLAFKQAGITIPFPQVTLSSRSDLALQISK